MSCSIVIEPLYYQKLNFEVNSLIISHFQRIEILRNVQKRKMDIEMY